MKARRGAGGPELQQEAGLTLWQQLDAGRPAGPKAQTGSRGNLSLHVSQPPGPRLPLAPRPGLWLGSGCERGTRGLKPAVRAGRSGPHEHQLAGRQAGWPGCASVDRKGEFETGPLAPGRSSEAWPLAPVWGHRSLGPGWGGTHPHRLAVEKEMGTPASPRPQAPARRRDGGFTALCQQQRDERAAKRRTGAWTWAQKGRQSRGPPPWRSRKAASQWAPAQGHLHLIGKWPRAASILLHLPDARQGPWPLKHPSGWATGSISDLLEPLRRPDQWRCGRPTHPGTPTLCPGPWIWPARAWTVFPWSPQRDSGHLRHGRAGPGTVAAAEDGRGPGSACTPGPLCPAAGAGPRVRGPAGMPRGLLAPISGGLAIGSRPGPSIERRLRGLRPWAILWWLSLQPSARSAAGCSWPGALELCWPRGAPPAISVLLGPPNWAARRRQGQHCNRLGGPPPRPGRPCFSGLVLVGKNHTTGCRDGRKSLETPAAGYPPALKLGPGAWDFNFGLTGIFQ